MCAEEVVKYKHHLGIRGPDSKDYSGLHLCEKVPPAVSVERACGALDQE